MHSYVLCGVYHFVRLAADAIQQANIPEVMQDVVHYSSEMPVRYYGRIVSKSPEGL